MSVITTPEANISVTQQAPWPILSVQGVTKHFPIRGGFFNQPIGAVQALDDVSLNVMAGETIGIVGESGCGKSTLARCILQLLRPNAGQVLYQPQAQQPAVDLTQLSNKALQPYRQDLQLIFQNPTASLNPRMTIEQCLMEPFEIHKIGSKSERIQRVKELLDQVGLSSLLLSRYPHELSGGQCQRVGIARALALKPKVIIADEAVSALDVSVQAQILNLMQDLKKEFGLTYIFISHNLSVVEYISDRVGVMYLGKMVELAPSAQLYHHAKHPYTQALLSAIPQPKPGATTNRILLEGDLPSPANPPVGCRFHTRCPYATEVCEIQPAWEAVNDEGHFVACHHYKQI